MGPHVHKWPAAVGGTWENPPSFADQREQRVTLTMIQNWGVGVGAGFVGDCQVLGYKAVA